MPALRLLFSSLTLAALLVSACGGDTSGTGGQTTSTSTNVVCAADAGAMVFAKGLSASAEDGSVKIAFVDASPAPPAKGANSFVVDVTDGSGNAVSGADIKVSSYMPAHGHYATVVPTVKASSQAGRYEISEVDLFMIGLWEVTFTVTPPGGAAEPVLFRFCVEG